MRLFYVQQKAAYESLKRDGRFHVTVPYAGNGIGGFDLWSYDWLVGKMEDKIGKRPDGMTYPIWAWFRQEFRNEFTLDIRDYGMPGDELVLLELEIPEKNVVLTDYDKWCVLINEWPVIKSEDGRFIITGSWSKKKGRYYELYYRNVCVSTARQIPFLKQIAERIIQNPAFAKAKGIRL